MPGQELNSSTASCFDLSVQVAWWFPCSNLRDEAGWGVGEIEKHDDQRKRSLQQANSSESQKKQGRRAADEIPAGFHHELGVHNTFKLQQ